MDVSMFFVVVFGMATTFIGLAAIIFLTQAMGAVLRRMEKPTQAVAPAVPTVSAPSAPADGLTDEVRIAILAALAQEPGLDLSRVESVNIRPL